MKIRTQHLILLLIASLASLPSIRAASRLDDAALAEAHRKAQEFIEQEKQFHLGVLPSEQSNPKTRGMAETSQHDLPAAIHMLQSVDEDILPKARKVFAGPEYQRMVAAMRRAAAGEGRICFSGCGATGRLSILLETAWREFFADLHRQHPEIAAKLAGLEDRATSIMTGGDFALIRSVENFEDHAVFGRQQVREAGLKKGDVLVAITEGGETSSVIGTVWQAVDNGAEVFFVFNNPADVLAQHIERSRQVIEDARITKLDLSSGPMALAGSTRMQATTAELLVVGAALETALADTLAQRLSRDELTQLHAVSRTPADFADDFNRLLVELERPDAVRAMAAMVDFEAKLYGRKGLVTYMADRCLLDIFTDTTERSPTFMLPKFRVRRSRLAALLGFRQGPVAADGRGLAKRPPSRPALPELGCRVLSPSECARQITGKSSAIGRRGLVQVPDRQRGRPLALRPGGQRSDARGGRR